MAGCLALIRVRVPDRPGALGLVASRIGALKGDIVGIEVLDRNDGDALDELAVVLPDADLIAAVTREIDEVDGVTTESVNIVEALPEPRLDAVRTATELCGANAPDALVQALTDEAARCVRADWCAVIDGDQTVASTVGCPPNPAELAVAVFPLGGGEGGVGASGRSLAVGRGSPLRAGETDLIRAWCEFADALATRESRSS